MAGLEVRLGTVGREQMAADLDRGAAAIEAFNSRVANSKRDMDLMRGAADQLIGKLAGLAAIAGGGAGLGSLIMKGFEFNSMLQDSQLGIGALISSFYTWEQAGKKVSDSAESLNLSMLEATRIQGQLKNAALTTTATYDEMLQGFQAGFAPMSRAGIAMNDMVKVTQRLTQAMGVLRVPMFQLGIEMRQFFEGDVARSRLLQGLGITKKELDAAVASGTALELVTERTEAFRAAGRKMLETWTGALSNIKDALEQTLGAATKTLFEDVTRLVMDLGGQLLTITDNGAETTATLNAGLIGALERAAVALRILVVIVKESVVGAFHDLNRTIEDAGGWTAVIERLVKGFTVLASAIQMVGQAVFFAIVHPIDTVKGLFTTLFGGIAAHIADFLEMIAKPVAQFERMANFIANPFAAAGAGQGAGPKLDAAAEDNVFGRFAKGLRDWTIDMTKGNDEFAEFEQRMDRLGSTTQRNLATVDKMFKAINEGVEGPPRELMNRSGTRKPVPPSDTITNALDKWAKFKAEVEVGLNTAGLDGFEKALGDVETKYDRINLRINEQVKLLAKAHAPVDADDVKHVRELVAAAESLDIGKISQEASRKFTAALTEMDGKVANSVDFRIAQEARGTEAFITEAHRKALSWAQTNEELDAADIARDAAIDRLTEQTAQKRRLAHAGERHDWDALWTDIEKRVKDGLLTLREGYAEQAANLLKYGNTAAEGIAAGMYAIQAKIPSLTQSVASGMESLWGSLTQSFDDGFYAVISGKLDSLKDVFSNLWDSVLHTFSKFLAEMLQRYLMTLLKMGDGASNARITPGGGSGTDFEAIMAQGHGAPGATGSSGGGFSMAGGQGWGVAGAAVGGIASVGNGKYNSTGTYIGAGVGAAVGIGSAMIGGLSLGAALGTSAGPIGAIIGAIVGLIVGILASPNTEKHVEGLFQNMLSGSAKTWVKGTGPRTGEGEEFTPGRWETVTNNPQTGVEAAGRGVLDKMQSTLVDVFRSYAPDKASDLAKAYQEAIQKAFANARFDIAAGSDEDIQKDIDLLMKSILPKVALQAAFGQIGYGPTGNRDSPGGIGGIDLANLPGMDRDGNYIQHQLYDPDAPIPKMLTGLGVTAAKVKEIAQRLTTEDPTKFLAYLQKFVAVAVGFRDLTKDMGQGTGELFKGFAQEQLASPAETFRKPAAAILDLFKSLDMYSGDEQLEKAAAALQTASQFWEQMKAAARDVWNLAQQLHQGLMAQASSMQNQLADTLDPTGATRRAKTTVFQAWRDINDGTAHTPDQIASATRAAQEAIQFLFNGFMATIQKALQLSAQLHEQLTGQRAGMGTQLNELLNPGSGVAAARGLLSGFNAKINNAKAPLTPEELAAAGQEASAAVQTIFEDLISTIKEALQLSKQLHDSIQGQRVSMRDQLADLRDPGAADARAQAAIAGSWGAIQNAKTPAEIATATKSAQDAIQFLFQGLIARIKEAQATIQSLQELRGMLYAAGASPTSRTASSGQYDALVIETKVGYAATLSGNAQIQAIKEVEAAARTMYQAQLAMIQQIDTNTGELGKSIAAQKFGMKFETMTPEQQAASVLERIKSLRDSISTATDPTQVKGITDEIQALVSQYWQMLPDSNKEAARTILDQILDQTQQLAETAYAQMRDKLVSANEKVAAALETAAGLLKTNIDAASEEVGKLTFQLDELDKLVQQKLGGIITTAAAEVAGLQKTLDEIDTLLAGRFKGVITEASNGIDALGKTIGTFDTLVSVGLTQIVNDIIAEGGLLRAEIEAQKLKFLDLKTPTADLVQPLKDQKEATDKATTSLGFFTAALDAAVIRLGNVGANSTATTGGASPGLNYATAGYIAQRYPQTLMTGRSA